MKIDFRIHLGMFIERALAELNATIIMYEIEGGVHPYSENAFYEDKFIYLKEFNYMEDTLINYMCFFPIPELEDYMHLFYHPLKNNLKEFVTTMKKVLKDIRIHKKHQLKFDVAISYFTNHPSLNIDEMINQMEIDWSKNDNTYWEKAFNKFTDNFSYASKEREIIFTNVEDLYPVNSTEEKYFSNEDYLAILKSRDLGSFTSLYTETSRNDTYFTQEEKACWDFIKILMNEYYLPLIMNYDSEFRLFITSINEIIEEKFDLLQSKKLRGIYENEWGVQIVDQWARDLMYFASNIVLESVREPSFLLGLKIDSLENAKFYYYFKEEYVSHAIISYAPIFPTSEKELVDLFLIENYENNIVRKVALLCDFLLKVKIIEKEKSESENKDTTNTMNDLMDLQNNRENVDAVTVGSVYENKIRSYLENLGYSIKMTPKTGDQGVDLIAEKDGKKYAIQCKYYTGQVGNAAVQEVLAGKYYYDCHHACVVTNSTFTPSAMSLANKTGVLLCSDNNLQIFH